MYYAINANINVSIFSLSIMDQLPLNRGAFQNAKRTSLETQGRLGLHHTNRVREARRAKNHNFAFIGLQTLRSRYHRRVSIE